MGTTAAPASSAVLKSRRTPVIGLVEPSIAGRRILRLEPARPDEDEHDGGVRCLGRHPLAPRFSTGDLLVVNKDRFGAVHLLEIVKQPRRRAAGVVGPVAD